MTTPMPTIVYVTDPLCLWCYAFSNTVEAFAQSLPAHVQFSTINGGLFPAERAQPCTQSFQDYLKNAAKEVTRRSGVEFSAAFWTLLNTPGYRYDTEPAAKASVVIKRYCDEARMRRFIHAVQHAFFVEGRDVTQMVVLADIAEAVVGASPQTFLEMYQDDNAQFLTQAEYDTARQMGARGFPALFLFIQEQGYRLASGFVAKEELQNIWRQVESMNLIEPVAAPTCSIEGC